MNPYKGRCDRCKSYKAGYCESLDDEVEGWWTGCCMWKQDTPGTEVDKKINDIVDRGIDSLVKHIITGNCNVPTQTSTDPKKQP